MAKTRFGLSPVAAFMLCLAVSSSVLVSVPTVAHAQFVDVPVDDTGKVGGVFLRPGVRDEFKSNASVAWSHTLDTLRGIQGGESQRQQIIARYQDYAILASMSDSTGDFQFDIWTVLNTSSIRIYVPSNFTFAYVSSGVGNPTSSDMRYSVWTDITNDYSYISVSTLPIDDPIAPGWLRIEIGRLPALGVVTLPSFTILPGLHHIRFFHVRAPFTAGLYHFKIYVDGVSIGNGNYPIAIVKSSLQPAYVTGLVALRGLAPPTNASGRVIATGTMSSGGFAEAMAYFGPNDFQFADARASYYRYWMFGLPAGTFDLTASASGFLKVTSRISVSAGQSLRCDFELELGPLIHVTVWSKDDITPIPWGNLWQLPFGTNNPFLPLNDTGPHRDILIRLLNEYDESVGYWASDDIFWPFGPRWNALTIDGNRSYSPWILKPSTIPSWTTYGMDLTDVRGLPSVTLDGHVPEDRADLVEGIPEGFYRVEIQVTGYVMRETDDWQRTVTISTRARSYVLETDLRRSAWINATGIIREPRDAPASNATIVIVARSTDGFEKALAAGTWTSNATQYTMVLEGFNAVYNGFRNDTDYQDYGLEPAECELDVYMADMGTPWTGFNGTGWYVLEEDLLEVHVISGARPITVLFHLKPCFIEFLIRSIQLQEPLQLMPWTFPGAGIRVAIVSELGIPAGSLEPFFYGLVQDDGTIPTDPFDFDTSPVGWHAMLRVRYTGTDPTPIAALAGSYPTRIEEGKYYVQVFTVGYIQRADCTVYIVPGFGHDVQLDLVQGTHVRVELRFTHENVATAFNGFVRVEVYNQEGTLIGASIYAGAAPNPRPGNYLPYSTLQDWKLVHGPAEGANTTIATAQRAYISALRYGVPPITWALWPAMNRSDANRLNMTVGSSVVFDVFGFHSYSGDSDSRMEQFWANGWDTTNGAMQIDSGMRGSRDMLDLEGSGSLTVRVWAFDPYGPDGVFNSTGRDGIFGNDDDYTAPDPIDAGISDFRAYAQVTELENVEAPWTGTVAVRTTLEEQPSLLGTVSWIDMYGDLRTLPWAQVVARTADDVWASSATGSYRLWLPQGPHEILVTTVGNEQLWQPFQFEIVLSRTGVHIFNDVTLQTAETVTPEFTSQTWVFAIPLIATSALVSKRQRNRAARSDN